MSINKSIKNYFLKILSNCSLLEGFDKLISFLYNLKILYPENGIKIANSINLKVSDSTSGSS